MAGYLQEKDDKPTFDIDLDMTITGESNCLTYGMYED